MGYAQKILPHYTYDDYVQWEGRWELIEGHPIAMSPSPIARHQWIANLLQVEFTLALRASGCKNCKVYPSLDFKIADDTVVQPDISIACGETTQKFLDFPPVLVVEILSPSTALRDKNTKFDLYESQGVKYYLIVDIDQELIELYELINGSYQLTKKDRNFTHDFTFDPCSVTIDFKAIW